MMGYTERATSCSGSRGGEAGRSTPASRPVDTSCSAPDLTRVLLDAGSQLRVHVLQGANPHAHHPGPQVAEVFPGQRLGPERLSPVRGDRRGWWAQPSFWGWQWRGDSV